MSQLVGHTTDASFAQDIASGVALVDFWAEWCQPCRMMIPRLDQLAEKIGEKAKILKMNVDEQPMTARSFRVMGIPTMIIFKDGKHVEQLVGIQEVDLLERKLLSYLDQK